jgi:glutamate racemase
MIIVACNTATAMALEVLKNNFKGTPIIGVIEPGSIQASLDSRSKKIGVIGTVATINSKAYDIALKLVDKEIQVFSKECPLFVPFVEEGMVEGEAINLIVEHYLSSFKNNIDTMILGCTHYPLLKPVIKNFVKDIKLVDSASAIATHAKNILIKKSLMSEVVNSNELECFVTDLPRKFEKLGEIFLGETIKQPHLVDDF